MIAHGYTKVFGGLHHHVEFVRSMHLPGWLAYLSAGAEFGGGILVVVGFLTRFAAACICINMLVAIFGVHLKNGFLGQGNYQFPLALAAIAFSLIFTGSGPISIDWMRGRGR
jgi:putative oxidoreductase